MDENLEDLVLALREERNEPKAKNKWKCPICCGSCLSKGKVTQTKTYDMNVEVTTSMGELEIDVSEKNETLEHIKFPIRYCPWCGRKIRKEYRKKNK